MGDHFCCGHRDGRMMALWPGQDLAALRESQVNRVRVGSIGFIFQTFNLIPTLTAQEDVETALVPLGVGRTSAGAAPRGRWPTWGSAIAPATCRRSCPAASSSGWRSPGLW
jgi:hypothetical protein